MKTLKQKIIFAFLFISIATFVQAQDPFADPQTTNTSYLAWVNNVVPNTNLIPVTGDVMVAVTSDGTVVGKAKGASQLAEVNGEVHSYFNIFAVGVAEGTPLFFRYYDSSTNEIYTIGDPVETSIGNWPGSPSAGQPFLSGFGPSSAGTVTYNQPQQNPSPVTLKNFRIGKSTCESIDIEWTTVSEINNDGWNIEKSYDGRSWEEIGFVAGKGNSSDLQKYTFTDRAIEDGYSAIYYRLNQVDLDGRSTLSDVVKTSIDCAGDFSFFPNPASSIITLNNMGTGQVDILSASGKRVATGITSDEYDVSHLNKGVYLVRYRLNQTISHKKLIIQ